MATIDNRPPARLLSWFARYPNPAVWGFPLDTNILLARFKETAPNTSKERGLTKFGRAYFSELEAMCQTIWPSDTIAVIQVCSDMQDLPIVLMLVKSTRPDDRFLPPPDKVKELKAAFAAKGFTEEPGWYRKSR